MVAPGAKTPLNDKFAADVDNKTSMEPGKLIEVAIKGLMNDQFEIYPGMARVLKAASRIAPGFILKQVSKPVDVMLSDNKQFN